MLKFTTATFTSYNLVLNIKPSETGFELNYITELTSEKDIYMYAKKQWTHVSSKVTKEMGSSKFPSKSFLSKRVITYNLADDMPMSWTFKLLLSFPYFGRG